MTLSFYLKKDKKKKKLNFKLEIEKLFILFYFFYGGLL